MHGQPHGVRQLSTRQRGSRNHVGNQGSEPSKRPFECFEGRQAGVCGQIDTGAYGKRSATVDRARYLDGWITEPYFQNRVIAVLQPADSPLTLREISQRADVPLRPTNRILYRLFKKGLASRYKLPMQRHAFCRKRWVCVPYAARRMLFVYKWVGPPPR